MLIFNALYINYSEFSIQTKTRKSLFIVYKLHRNFQFKNCRYTLVMRYYKSAAPFSIIYLTTFNTV